MNQAEFGKAAGQATGILGTVAATFGGLAGRYPESVLGWGAAIVAVMLAGLALILWRGHSKAQPGEHDRLSPLACTFCFPFVAALALTFFGVLPGISPQSVAHNTRMQVDRAVSAVGLVQSAQSVAAGHFSARFVAATPQANTFVQELQRALTERGRSVHAATASPSHVEIAGTVDSVYTSVAAGEIRARAAINFRARGTGLLCTVNFGA